MRYGRRDACATANPAATAAANPDLAVAANPDATAANTTAAAT